MNKLLITPEEFAGFRSDVSKGWKNEKAKIKRCINEAQTVDLYDVLGSFVFDVIQNKDESNYQDLLSGSAFEIDGIKYAHIGLKNYLANLAYARFLTYQNTTHTSHGFVGKTNQDSEQVSWTQINYQRKDIQVTAAVQFEFIDKYLCQHPEIFKNYSNNNNPNINTYSNNSFII